jgi:hypothetical protein
MRNCSENVLPAEDQRWYDFHRADQPIPLGATFVEAGPIQQLQKRIQPSKKMAASYHASARASQTQTDYEAALLKSRSLEEQLQKTSVS